MFAAVGTVEPPILELQTATIDEGEQSWSEARLPLIKDRIRSRLAELSRRVGDSPWLDGSFSAADIMMVHVLLRLKPCGLLDEYATLAAYAARAQARPAYQRAFTAQLAVAKGAAGGLP